MITTNHTAHDIAKIANDPTKSICIAVYEGPENDLIELWYNPMFGHRDFLKYDPVLFNTMDAWGRGGIEREEDFLSRPYANFRPLDWGQRLHAMLFEQGWRIKEMRPYDGPVGNMGWHKYREENLLSA